MVEGNIGCGKSTFLRYFQQLSPKNEVMHEPLYLWKDARGYDLFELMYHDQRRWSVPFQAQVLVTLLDRQSKPPTKPIRLLERSIHSSRYCFTENMHNNGSISDADYEELLKIFQWILKNKSGPVDLIVYLRASPTVCFERLRARNRSGEEDIPLRTGHRPGFSNQLRPGFPFPVVFSCYSFSWCLPPILDAMCSLVFLFSW
ncbi:unnamed protein product [Schistosoma intercalatum]|nr:unnamed protein product [Schistosoma intercalatum]